MNKKIVKFFILLSILFYSNTVLAFDDSTFVNIKDNNIFSNIKNDNIEKYSKMKSLLEEVKKADPGKSEIGKIYGEKNIFSSKSKIDGVDIDFLINRKSKNIELKKDNLGIKIGFPKNIKSSKINTKNIDGQVVVNTKKVNLVVQNIEGGVRNILSINSKDSDKYYDFPITVPRGYFLKKKKDGSVVIKNRKGKVHTTIAKPWAKDSNGVEIETSYDIIKKGKNYILRQYVDIDSAKSFPVHADPLFCSKTIRYVGWLYRDGSHPWSASIKTTKCGRYIGVDWIEFYNETPYNYVWPKWSWTNTVKRSLWNQIACHNGIAYMSKKVYNVEPGRPDVGLWNTIMAKCNPE